MGFNSGFKGLTASTRAIFNYASRMVDGATGFIYCYKLLVTTWTMGNTVLRSYFAANERNSSPLMNPETAVFTVFITRFTDCTRWEEDHWNTSYQLPSFNAMYVGREGGRSSEQINCRTEANDSRLICFFSDRAAEVRTDVSDKRTVHCVCFNLYCGGFILFCNVCVYVWVL